MWGAIGVLASVLSLVYYYYKHVVHAPKIVCAPSKRNLALGAALDKQLRVFRPLWWGFNTHVQTIVNVTLRTAAARVRYEREVVKMTRTDGGQTALDWAVGNNGRDAPVCMMLTGYTGSSEELEIRILVQQLLDDGFEVCVMHFRGLGGCTLTTPRFGDCAPEDVEDVIDAIRAKRPSQRLLGLGVSAGANCLCLYAGTTGAKCQLSALASISNPFQIYATLGVKLKADFVGKHVYDPFFVPKRRAVVKRHSELFASVKNFSDAEVDAARGAIEFDKAVSLKTTDFATIEEFYTARSSGNVLHRIAIPTLFINAADDPFMDINSYPERKILENEHLFGVLTERGGHLGFMQSEGWLGLSNRTWDEVLAAEWLRLQVNEARIT